MTDFVLNTLNGISYGMILFLLASGLSLIMGVMGVLNLAHGAMYMVGAYVGWTVAVRLGLSFWVGALAGGLLAGLVGLIIERLCIARLYGRLDQQILVTWGFTFILTNLSIWIWTAQPRAPFTAPLMDGTVQVAGIAYPASRLGIILIGLVLAVGLWWLQDKTRIGAIVRAGMDDREITMALGINLRRVSTLVFFLGAFIAGFAGVIGAQLMGVTPALALDVLLLALVVVIVGGVGSVQGALLGGVLIGLIDAFGKAISPAVSMFFIYLTMIVILLVRPSGLLRRT